MSATIDTTLFTNYFGGCPIIEMEGRTYPVQRNDKNNKIKAKGGNF